MIITSSAAIINARTTQTVSPITEHLDIEPSAGGDLGEPHRASRDPARRKVSRRAAGQIGRRLNAELAHAHDLVSSLIELVDPSRERPVAIQALRRQCTTVIACGGFSDSERRGSAFLAPLLAGQGNLGCDIRGMTYREPPEVSA